MRPQRRRCRYCVGFKKQRATRRGDRERCVWTEKSYKRIFLASDLQHPSRASWQTKHSSLLTCTWPRSPRPSSSTFGNILMLMVSHFFILKVDPSSKCIRYYRNKYVFLLQPLEGIAVMIIIHEYKFAKTVIKTDRTSYMSQILSGAQ